MEVVQIPASCGKAADLPTLCSLATDFQGCLTSQMLPKFGEDFSTRGGEIRPLSWGRGHRLAVLFFLWILAWHVDSWKTGVAENPETRGELDATCQRLRDDHTSS